MCVVCTRAFVYMCVHISAVYIYIYINIYMHTYIHMCVVCKHAFVYTCTYICNIYACVLCIRLCCICFKQNFEYSHVVGVHQNPG